MKFTHKHTYAICAYQHTISLQVIFFFRIFVLQTFSICCIAQCTCIGKSYFCLETTENIYYYIFCRMSFSVHYEFKIRNNGIVVIYNFVAEKSDSHHSIPFDFSFLLVKKFMVFFVCVDHLFNLLIQFKNKNGSLHKTK